MYDMKTRKKWYRNIIAAVISFAMVIGIFSSMQIEAKAANNYSVDVTDSHSIENAKTTTYYPGDTLTITNIEKYPDYNPDHKSNYHFNTTVFVKADQTSLDSLCLDNSIYNFPTNLEKKYQNPSFKLLYINVNPGSVYCGIEMEFLLSYDSDEATPSSETGSEATPSHECNFQWVTTVDPQPNADGVEEYKCVSCGTVKDAKPIPASMATVKKLYGLVKDAPANGTVTTDFGKLCTISDYLLKKMAERNDVTTAIQFEYNNMKLQITFPAGTDYTPVLTDTETMYGFYGAASKLGLTVTERQ